MIRVFDAFSGIGGFRSALERVGGFKFVAWCEIDGFAQKAYRALYDTGGEQFYENIRNIDAGELEDFDLLVEGFPCQPFSVCGARKGFADERGDLFFELARILESKYHIQLVYKSQQMHRGRLSSQVPIGQKNDRQQAAENDSGEKSGSWY